MARLGGLVERGAGLVEEQPVGLDQQRAGEGQALLLAGRQHHRPVAALVQPVGEMAELAQTRQRLADLGVAVRLRLVGVAQAPPSACRSGCRASAAGTGPSRALRDADRAAAERPQAGQHAKQRGLAAARRPLDHHPLARARSRGRHPRAARAPFGSATSTSSSVERRLRRRRDVEAALGRLRRRLVAAMASREAGEPVDGRLPVRQRVEAVDEPGQRALHLAEGAGGLHDARPAGSRRRSSAAPATRNGKMPATWP